VLQLFRIFNSTLSKKKESRRRNLQFHLPMMIPLSPQIRLIQDDASYVTPNGIWEDYCRRNEVDKDEPIVFMMEKQRQIPPSRQGQGNDHLMTMKLEALNHIQERLVPKDLVREYFAATHPSFDAFWLFRRQVAYQLAALTYMTFTMHITQRTPNKMSIARRNGNIWGMELLPLMSNSRPYFHNSEAVPFRLTPTLQLLMGPIHTEGIFTCAMMAIARCLTSDSSYTTTTTNTANAANGATGVVPPTNGILEGTNCELEHHLSIFLRDEVTFWYTSQHRQNVKEGELRENVQRNAEVIVNKALGLTGDPSASGLPANQPVVDLVSKATNPANLCQMELQWMPWL
jgi:transformation/transcription domain-associated protein